MDESLVAKSSGGIDAFWLKVIAIIGMTFDHIGIVFGDMMPFAAKCLFYMPGGLTYPIMAFLMTEGFRHTSNVKRYMGRLLIFAFATQPIYMWAFRAWALPFMPLLNIMFTLALGLSMILLGERMKNRILFRIILVVISILTAQFFDWGLVGVPLVYVMHILRKREKSVTPAILVLIGVMVLILLLNVLGGGYYYSLKPEYAQNMPALWAQAWRSVLPSLLFYIGSAVTIFLIARYNGARGRNMRFFFYAYYPAHILLLALIRGLFFGDWAFLP